MLVLVVSFCFVLLFCYLKKNKEKRKQKNNSNALAEDGLEMMLSSIKKNGLDYLQKDDFNGKLRKISNHLRFIYSTQ